MCRKRSSFLFQQRGGFVKSGPHIDSAAAAKRATAERNRRGIAFNETDVLQTNTPQIGGDLSINSLVSLTVSGSAGGNDNLTGSVNAHLGALKGANSCALYITTVLAELLLLLPKLLIICYVQCTT